MDRRELLGAVGAAAAGLVATGRAGAAPTHDRDKAHEDCLKACTHCKEECDAMFHHCLGELAAGKATHAKTLQLAADCAAFCDLSATMIARMSPLMVESCRACAEACAACAAACGKFDSAEMRACAKACRDSETSCREMVKAMGGKTDPH